MNIRALLILLVLLQGRKARAQGPQITVVWPPGGPVGSKVDARIEGGNLAAVSTVWVGGSGVTAKMGAPAKDGNAVPVTLEIAKDASPGAHEVRVISPKGGSNPGYVWVGSLPEVAEVEPNDQPEKAMPLSNLPVTVHGRIDKAEDVDWYSFRAEAGDTFVFDACANRLYSPLDTFLELHDTEGHLLGSAMEGYDRDPRLIHTFKTAGTYRIQVRDTLYRGGGGYVYRLSVGKLPTITSFFPPGGKRGSPLKVEVNGVNLKDMREFSINLPAVLPENQPWIVVPQTPNGPALPVTLSGDDNPQANDLFPPGPASVVINSLPVTLNGRISRPKETDNFEFAAQQGKPILIDVRARSIGSRLDAYLQVFDKAGKELQNSEEQIGRDARMTFNPPATASFRLQVTSLDNHTGPDYYYRISIGPPGTPDFRLSATPDVVSLSRNQTVALQVTAERKGGFNGPIEVSAAGAPAGVKASKLVLGPGQNAGSLTLTGAGDAAFNAAQIQLTGSAMVDGKTMRTHTVVPIANLPRPGEGQVVPRVVGFQAAAVTDAVPLYTLSLESDGITLDPGQTVMLKVKAIRKPNDNASNPAIGLTLADLPAGVSAETPAIPEKAGEVTIKITASKDAKPVTQSAQLTGKLGENVQAAPSLLISVRGK